MPDGRVDFIVEHTGDDGEDAGFRFEIRDTGVGMDEAFIPHMFEPFEQEDEGITTLNGGTGLGLSIARNIIEFMGGHIDAYSEKGKGSTFIVNVNLKRVRNSGEKLRGQGDVQRPTTILPAKERCWSRTMRSTLRSRAISCCTRICRWMWRSTERRA